MLARCIKLSEEHCLKTHTPILVSAIIATAFIAEATIGGTTPLAAVGNTRKVSATVNTTTSIVTAPVVEVKVASTNTWVPAPVDSQATEVISVLEQPIRPYLPAITAFLVFDCDGNGVSDSTQISNGAQDSDHDGVLDSCEFKVGDLNLNGIIDGADVSILLGWWGITNPLYGDLDGDNVVNARDLGLLLGRFGVVVY